MQIVLLRVVTGVYIGGMFDPHTLVGFEVRCWRARAPAVFGLVSHVESVSEQSFELVLRPAFLHQWPTPAGESEKTMGSLATVFVRRDLMEFEPDGRIYCDQGEWFPSIVSISPREHLPAGRFAWPVDLRIDRNDSTWICDMDPVAPQGLRFSSDGPRASHLSEAEVVAQLEPAGITLATRNNSKYLAIGDSIQMFEWVIRAAVSGRWVTNVTRKERELLSELTSSGGDAAHWFKKYHYLTEPP